MRRVWKILLAIFLFGVLVASACCYWGWSVLLKPNFQDNARTKNIVYIEKGVGFDEFVDKLIADSLVVDVDKLRIAGKLMGYYDGARSLPAGCYKIDSNLGSFKMVRLIASRCQQPVKLVVNNVRLPEQLAGKVASQLLVDSIEVLDYFNDEEKMASLGYSREQLFTLFVANTYEVWWTISVDDLMRRMAKESKSFWNESRRAKAEKIGLTPDEVVILASIVEEESNYRPEQPRIAGLYLNRLDKGIPLQSDPTVKFALGDFTLNRILFKHLDVESPYNTYKIVGLPPSPIRLPQIATIDAVLNAEKHNYLYMCAHEDLNGTHRFAVTLAEHNRNADRYHRALTAWLRKR